MSLGTKHFMLNRSDDWENLGTMEGLVTQEDHLLLKETGKGIFISSALDSMTPRTIWNRLRMCAKISSNTHLRLYLYCSDDDEILPPNDPEAGVLRLDDWIADKRVPMRFKEQFFMDRAQKAVDNPKDLLLYEYTGRYMWFCLVFLSFSGDEISVDSLKLEFPRVAFIDYLPQIYRGSESRNSFLARFIGVFQSVYVDLEDKIDLAPAYYDALVADRPFLDWLTNWLSISESFLWDEKKLRLLVQCAARLYKMKGTKSSLGEIIALYADAEPLLIEQFEIMENELWREDRATLASLFGENGYTFTVLLPRSTVGADDYVKILKVIDRFKPVDAICNLVFLENAINLSHHCYLGMNSYIVQSEQLVLDSRGPVSSAPYLVE